MKGLHYSKLISFAPMETIVGKQGPSQGCFNDFAILTSETFEFGKLGKLLHQWCEESTRRLYWDNSTHLGDLVDHYRMISMEPGAEATVFYLEGERIAFSDCFPLAYGELQSHVPDITDQDFEMQFLLAPASEMPEEFRDCSHAVGIFILIAALTNFFKHDEIENIYVAPDKEHSEACHLATLAGFEYVGEVERSGRPAQLFCYTRKALKDQDNFLENLCKKYIS